MSALDDFVSATNWIEHLLGALFVLRHGGASRVTIDRREWTCPGEAEKELKRLHIPISGRSVHGDDASFWVSHKQATWARYVLRRKLAGNPVPAWDEAPPKPRQAAPKSKTAERVKGFFS